MLLALWSYFNWQKNGAELSALPKLERFFSRTIRWCNVTDHRVSFSTGVMSQSLLRCCHGDDSTCAPDSGSQPHRKGRRRNPSGHRRPLVSRPVGDLTGTLPALAMATSQRPVEGHGLPEPAADPGEERRTRPAASSAGDLSFSATGGSPFLHNGHHGNGRRCFRVWLFDNQDGAPNP